MARLVGKRVPVPQGPGIYTKRGNDPGKERLVFRVDDLKRSVLIGYVCKDDPAQMTPNEKYRDLYREEWKKQFGTEALTPMVLHFGMYAATNVIAESTKLLQYLNDAFSEKLSNQLLDYAMYAILGQTDSAPQYETRMSEQMRFNQEALSDADYSELLETGIPESEILGITKEWAIHCKEDLSIEDVWLYIDGSNEDCVHKGVSFAENGTAESGKIISFAYAVSTDGCPVTFRVYRGGPAHLDSMNDTLGFLRECGISVKGVILERDSCTADMIDFFDENRIQYAIMISEIPKGLDLDKTRFREDTRYLVRKTSLFAAQDTVQLFKDNKTTSSVTIFYDMKKGAEQLDTFLKMVANEVDRLETVIADGNVPIIASDFADVLCLSENGKEVIYIQSAIQQHIDDAGIYGIAHSASMTPEQAHDLYILGNKAKKWHSFVKTQLGYETEPHVHFDALTTVRSAVGFISSIIHHELEKAAQRVNMTATDFIRELDLIRLERIRGFFFYNHAEKENQVVLMKTLGKDANYLDELVTEVNRRFNDHAPAVKKRKPESKPKDKGPDKTGKIEAPKGKGKPGPKPGYKQGYFNADGSVQKKPGTKPGTKRTDYNKDGSLREKPGPKPGSHHREKGA